MRWTAFAFVLLAFAAPSVAAAEDLPRAAPPTVPPAKCPPGLDHPEEGEDVDGNGCKKPDPAWERGSIFGVRGAVSNTSGADHDGTYVAAMVQGAGEQFKTRKLLTWHGSSHFALGGGSGKVEGGLGATVTVGARAPLGEHHGPLARIGLGGELLGNRRFYFSRIALPLGELAYQYADNHNVLELGGRAAPLLTGRYDTGYNTRRELGGGSLEWGGYLAAHSKIGRIDVKYTRIDASSNFPGGTVQVLRGWACGYVKEAVAVCADGMYIDGNAYFGLPHTVRDVSSVYVGITVGVLAF